MIKSGDPRVIPVDPLFAGNKQFSVNRTEVDRVDREDRVNTPGGQGRLGGLETGGGGPCGGTGGECCESRTFVEPPVK